MESFSMSDKKTKPPYFEMGQRIIKARETATDMNQSEMTKALGLQEPTYGNYERGNRKMPPDTMQKFSKITGCYADWVYLGKGPMRNDPKEAAWLNLYRNASEKKREALAALLSDDSDS